MKRVLTLLSLFVLLVVPKEMKAQVDEDQLGAWYMYFWSLKLADSPWGFQGDIQYRNWNIIGDLEQLLLRGGATYTPKKTKVRFTLGYAYIAAGAFGENPDIREENRFYQEAFLPQDINKIIYIFHRFRFEQRYLENEDYRTRFRYSILVNIPLNQKNLKKGAFYFSFYNEIFINGQKRVNDTTSIELFDRNRLYGGFGYCILDNLRTQVGFMRQYSDFWTKNQLQAGLQTMF